MATSINLDTASRVDITCRRGDTFSLQLTFKDEAGDLIDLSSGYEWMMQVRETDTSSTAILDGDSSDANASDFVFAGTNSGLLWIVSEASVMATVPGGVYVYDLQSMQGGAVTTWMYGKFTVNEDVSV